VTRVHSDRSADERRQPNGAIPHGGQSDSSSHGRRVVLGRDGSRFPARLNAHLAEAHLDGPSSSLASYAFASAIDFSRRSSAPNGAREGAFQNGDPLLKAPISGGSRGPTSLRRIASSCFIRTSTNWIIGRVVLGPLESERVLDRSRARGIDPRRPKMEVLLLGQEGAIYVTAATRA